MSSTSLHTEADTLAGMKQDVPLFTHKLRRVLAGKSRVEVAEYINEKAKTGGPHLEAISTSGGTVRGWISQGTIPKTGQIHFIAEFAGCSADYLTDDRIPLEADPKQGGGSAPLSTGDLLAEIRERYIDQACRLDDYIKEVLGTPWLDVATRLMDLNATEELTPDLARAVELVNLRESIESRTVGPFLPVFKGKNVHESIQPYPLLARFENAKAIHSFRSAVEVVKIRHVLSMLGDDADLPEKITDGLAASRKELDRLAKSKLYLIQEFWGVANAGGLEQYFKQVIARIKTDLSPKAKTGDLPRDMKKLAKAMVEHGANLIIQDSAKQAAYEVNADKAWRDAALAQNGETAESKEEEKAAADKINDRMGERYSLLIQGFEEYAYDQLEKDGLDLN